VERGGWPPFFAIVRYLHEPLTFGYQMDYTTRSVLREQETLAWRHVVSTAGLRMVVARASQLRALPTLWKLGGWSCSQEAVQS